MSRHVPQTVVGLPPAIRSGELETELDEPVAGTGRDPSARNRRGPGARGLGPNGEAAPVPGGAGLLEQPGVVRAVRKAEKTEGDTRRSLQRCLGLDELTLGISRVQPAEIPVRNRM